ncbi:MAG: hypothetical protein BIFFINMI_02874 [Phycisphaerae bacterium]|nr:hypothetical protein [Phycisphaerae bacterium]
MNENTEGTIVLDGLLQGPVPTEPDGEGHLRDWVARAQARGLVWLLEIDGGSFSLLADKAPVEIERLGSNPANVIADALEELVKLFSPPQRLKLTSTIRSQEFQPGLAIQTLYAVGPDGAIHTRDRTIDCQTTAPPQRLSTAQLWRRVAIGAGVAVVLLGVSAIFVPYGTIIRNITERLRHFDPEEVEVQPGPAGQYFTVENREKRGAGDGRIELVLTLKRTEAYLSAVRVAATQPEQADLSLEQRMALEAVVRGYLTCEMFDKEGNYLGSAYVRIAGLRDKETIEVAILLPEKTRPTRLTFTF